MDDGKRYEVFELGKLYRYVDNKLFNAQCKAYFLGCLTPVLVWLIVINVMHT